MRSEHKNQSTFFLSRYVNNVKLYFVILLTCTSNSNPGRYESGTGWKGLSKGEVWNSRSILGPLLTISGTASPPQSLTRTGALSLSTPSYTVRQSCTTLHWSHALQQMYRLIHIIISFQSNKVGSDLICLEIQSHVPKSI